MDWLLLALYILGAAFVGLWLFAVALAVRYARLFDHQL